MAILPPFAVILAIAVFGSLVTFAFGYIVFSVKVHRVSRRLRALPKGYQAYVKESISAGLRSLPPDMDDDKYRTFRKVLINASRTPANYSSNAGALTLKGLTSSSKIGPQFTDKGESVGRKTIFGFFHPHASAGGGGERVLWAAVHQTLENAPTNIAAIYVGAERSGLIETPRAIVDKVQARFGISVDFDRVVFIYLRKRHLIDPASWPRFTLLGQAIGSCVLAYEAINHLVPDVFVDTMGLPFCYPLVSWLVRVPIVAYVHYPVVSKDMLAQVRTLSFKGLYWHLLMAAYGYILSNYSPLIMTNSSWTNNHIKEVTRRYHSRPNLITIVYPPVAVQDFEPPTEDQKRSPNVVYVAQFRAEKRHDLLLREFAKFVAKHREASGAEDTEGADSAKLSAAKPHLVLIGSVRNDSDKQRVYSLRLLSRELELGDDYVTFMLDAPWSQVLKYLNSSSVGVNAMWNEHFGMVMVEYMAAGLIPIGHDSAGPKLDIVVSRQDGEPKPGFLFKSPEDPDYDPAADKDVPGLAECFTNAFALHPADQFELRQRAFVASQQFSDDVFYKAWDVRVNVMLKLEAVKRKERLMDSIFD